MPEDGFRLIVGLGNPGEKYRFTRHNIGFMVADRLGQVHQIPLDKHRFKALFGRGTVGNQRVILAKPMTFMNRSGPAVTDLARFYRVGIQDILVIHDDIDLVFGKLNIKRKGGDGGHNGVKSIIEAFGSDAFARFRVGVGRPKTGQDVSAYVLDRFDAEQAGRLDDVISAAQGAVETALFKGLQEAMNRFSGKEV